jgi:dTDP-4-dehydrorhamnose reductase
MVEHYGLIPLYFDVRNPLQVAHDLDIIRPDVILNLAAKSDPDYCQEHYSEAIAVNFSGALNVYREAVRREIIVVQMSTAHIFTDRFMRHKPHTEDEPIKTKKFVNNYAYTKYAAEAARLAFPKGTVKIVRTSHLFDYVQIMHRFQRSNHIDAPTFMHRSYMYLPHFAKTMNQYLNGIMLMPEVLHIAGTETVSDYDFMRTFMTIMGMTKTSTLAKRKFEDPTHAPRPHWGGLNVDLSKRLKMHQFNYIEGLVQLHKDNVRG